MSSYGYQPQPAYAPSAQNLQFYPSTYAPNVPVSGHSTPFQAGYGNPQGNSYGYGGQSSAYSQGFGGAGGFGGDPAAGGVSGRMGEQGGLRTGWLAAFGTEGYDREPPLLEELGINFGHIKTKTLTVLNPFRNIDQHIMDDSDLAGPVLFFLLFGTFLLFSGKVHFGYIYGLALLGTSTLHLILSLMSPPLSPSEAAAAQAQQTADRHPHQVSHFSSTLTFPRSASVLGYCLLPLVLTSLIGIAVPMDSLFGYIIVLHYAEVAARRGPLWRYAASFPKQLPTIILRSLHFIDDSVPSSRLEIRKMGWFWADTAPSPARPPRALSRATPAPACPAHKSITAQPRSPEPLTNLPSEACPYIPPSRPAPSPQQSLPQPSTLSKLNPLNYMPTTLSQARAASQTTSLPTSRETSTIPRGAGDGNWEYPSPQQMYNAMLRKGYTDTPEDAVETMVAVHNFLNEGAWAEIVEWERRFSRGLRRGWAACRRGVDGAPSSAVRRELRGNEEEAETLEPRLVRFMGRPNNITPKAQLWQVAAWMFPGYVAKDPPFDRHDWYVLRRSSEGAQREVRYVIDYYSGPPELTGEPVFYLDVRPAIDGPTAAVERMMRWSGDVWWRASGGVVREKMTEEESK